MSLTKNEHSQNAKFYMSTVIMFFFSGFTSLIYQIIWIRQISLAVGSTSASMSLVLSIFFFGLAGGSYLIGRYHHKINSPILLYGKLEGFIGIYSAFLVYVLFHFQSLLVWLYPQGNIIWFSQFFKFILVFLFLSPPTFAMGATLPLLVKAFEQQGISKSKSVGLMYGVNTLGAVAGSFLIGFFMIPSVGIEYSNHIAVIINLLLFAVTWILTKFSFVRPTLNNGINIFPKYITSTMNLKHKSITYLGLAFACGYATISAEVVWSKYLGIFMGTNIYGLSLLLSILLLGIGVGSLSLPTIRKFVHRISLVNLLLLLALFLLMSLWLTTRLLGGLPVFTSVLAFYFGKTISLLQLKSVSATFILFPSTFISGMILPLLIELLSNEIQDLPRATGSVYSINTIGSIVASYLTGMFLIPILGSSVTMKIALFVLAASLLWTLIVVTETYKIRKYFLVPYLSVFIVIGLTGNLQFKDIIRSAYQQNIASFSNLSDLLKIFSDKQEEFVKIIEGETAIISLSHDKADGADYKKYLRLKTNGLNESVYDSQKKDALPKYEALLGLLPYVLLENPENAFLVGYGGGFTTHLLGKTNLKRVQVAELEKGIIESADYVWNYENPILKHPNVNLKIEDARFLLAVGFGAPYDIIASQPSHSWLSGVANLFTKEFFELVKSNLKPHGVFSQWLNLYNINEEALKSILITFYTVFPNGAVFTDINDDEIILIGSLEPLQFDIERATQVIQSPELSPLFENLLIKNGYDLLTHITLTRDQVIAMAEGVTLNTDRNALVETTQSKLFYNPQNYTVQQFLDDQFDADYEKIVSTKNNNTSLDWFQILQSLNQSANFTKYNKVLDKKKYELLNWQQLAQAYYQMERYQSAYEVISKQFSALNETEDLNLVLQVLIAKEDYAQLITLARLYSNKLNLYSQCLLLEAQVSKNEITSAAKTALKLIENQGEAYYFCGDYLNLYLGHYFYKLGQFEKSLSYLDDFYKNNSQNIQSIRYLIGSLLGNGMYSSSDAFMKEYLNLKEQEIDRITTLINYYERIHATSDAAILRKKLASL